MHSLKSRAPSNLKRFAKSVWFFPAILAVLLIGLAACNISGSSVGVFHQTLYGAQAHDPDLLYGNPKTIRSDEWLGSTQMTVMQVKTGFPTFNKNLGSGRDVSKLADAPIANWVEIFRPNNWSFFILPLAAAFAFKWWFIMFLTIVAGYFFTLRILPKQKLLAVILSVSFGLSPFLLWWYQSALFLPMAYGFLIMILGIRIIDQEKIPKIKSKPLTNVLYVSGLAYLGAAIGLLIYPPFSIPVMLAVIAFLLGYLIDKKVHRRLPLKAFRRPVIMAIASVILVATIILLFASQHKEMIERTANALYPGHRISPSGGLHFLALLDGFLMPLLQGSFRGLHFYTNQSGASNFILLLPFLLLPGILLQIREYVKSKKIDWLFTAIQICSLLFFAKVFIHFGDAFYKLLLLDRVPSARMIAGIGFIGFIYLLLLIKKLQQLKIPKKRLYIFSALYGLIISGVLFWEGARVIKIYPLFLNNYLLMIGLAAFFTAILVSFFTNKRLLGAVLLLVFTLGSSFRIVPLYRGLDFLQNSQIVNEINHVSKPGDDWIVLDNLYYENLPLEAGRGSVGGSQLYPDLKYWQPIGNGKYERIYNRQARAMFVTDPTLTEKMRLVQQNYFQIKFECSPFVHERADFVLVDHPVNYGCLKLVTMVSYPKATFYIYKISP